jgi:DNA ligase 1
LNDFTIHFTSDTLSAATSTGKTKYWRAHILQGPDGSVYTQSEAWQSTLDGGTSKVLLSTPYQVQSKNVGRANETTPLQQAELELRADRQKKIDKGYRPEGGASESEKAVIRDDFTLPMLAHPLSKKLHNVTFPLFAQPKFDGARALFNNASGFWSRQAKPYIPEVVAHLRSDSGDLTLDGELILPAPHTFQETVAAIKKFRPTMSPKLVFRVYDLVDESLGFRERWQRLREWHASVAHPQIELCPTFEVTTMDEVYELHARWTSEGYEGTMLRDPNARYTPGHRSDGLLKLKDFEDAEFRITGFSDGGGKDAGAIVFTCETESGIPFNARPEGTMEARRAMFAVGESYLGKMLTVRYQRRSDTGVPIFPVGVTVRSYE